MIVPWHLFHGKRYMEIMGSRPLAFKPIVAAWLAAVWFSAPLHAQQAPAEREADLLAQLREAEDPHAASLIESELSTLWSRSGSAAIDLLLRRGQDAMEAGDPEAAIEHLTAAIDYAPDFAEAYVARASAYYLTNRAGPALDDLRQALVLNPNQWQALGGFAALLEEIGREDDALEVWRRVHEMHPQEPQAAAAVNRLELALQGRTL
jgi:tetratricopeptide (TPR) repeat protein